MHLLLVMPQCMEGNAVIVQHMVLANKNIKSLPFPSSFSCFYYSWLGLLSQQFHYITGIIQQCTEHL